MRAIRGAFSGDVGPGVQPGQKWALVGRGGSLGELRQADEFFVGGTR
jgi:hypothetical protein